ncbi:MAG TPA: hypothetical protein VFJ97_16600 [Dermatophilaceae bacterium]|nr:hypothetical protein [Dermatophilaceae bacterium]
MSQRWLRTYLKDHYSAATGGVELFRRVAGSHGDPQVREAVCAVADEVDTDRLALRQFMRAVGAHPSRLGQALAWSGEKVGRLKPNGTLVRRSPLTDVVELEALSVAVEGKLRGWRMLLALAETDQRLDAELLTELVGRAERQRERLERLRLRVGTRVLSHTGAG